MKRIKNDTGVFYCEEDILPSVIKVCDMVKKHPSVLEPFRGARDDVKEILASFGFMFYPTVKKTTIFYEEATDCFFKVLHLLHLKEKALYFFIDRGRSIYNLSEYLSSNGILVPRVVAYGTFKKGRKPFWVMKRIPGVSLYDILIMEGKTVKRELLFRVIDKIVEIHRHNYWLGDAHLGHIFLDKEDVPGFIDIDGLRKNRHFILRNLAKDLACLNHPRIPLNKDEKMQLLDYYMDIIGIRNKDRFISMVKYFSKRRWKR